MYEAYQIAERIKATAKSRNITIKVMLEECGLSKNTLSSMSSGGSTPKSENLAKIADYLNCSVDYLLGRTEKPNIVADSYINGDNNGIQANVNTGNLTVNNGESKLEEMEAQLLKYFRQLEFEQKLDIVGDVIKKAKK